MADTPRKTLPDVNDSDPLAALEEGVPAAMERLSGLLADASDTFRKLESWMDQLETAFSDAAEAHSGKMYAVSRSARPAGQGGGRPGDMSHMIPMYGRLGTPEAKAMIDHLSRDGEDGRSGRDPPEAEGQRDRDEDVLQEAEAQLLSDEGNGLCPPETRRELLRENARLREASRRMDGMYARLRNLEQATAALCRREMKIAEIARLLDGRKRLLGVSGATRTQPVSAKKASRKLERADWKLRELLEALGPPGAAPDEFWKAAGDAISAEAASVRSGHEALCSDIEALFGALQEHKVAGLEAFNETVRARMSASIAAPPHIRNQVMDALDRLGAAYGLAPGEYAGLKEGLEVRLLTEPGPDVYVNDSGPNPRRVILLSHAIRDGVETVSPHAIFEEGSHALRSLFSREEPPLVSELFGSLGASLGTGESVMPFDEEMCRMIWDGFQRKGGMAPIPDALAKRLAGLVPAEAVAPAERGTEAGNLKVAEGFIDHMYNHLVPALTIQSMADTGFLETMMKELPLIRLPPEHVARLAMHYDSMCRRDTDWQERFKGYTKVCGFLLRPESLGRLRKRGLHEPATGEARSGRELRG